MSLINQVLRDLDARHAAQESRALPNEVRALPPAAADRRGVMAISALALLGLMGLGWWVTRASPASPAAVAPPSIAPPAAIETPPPPLLVIAPPVLPAGSETLAERPPLPGSRPAADAPAASLRMAASLTLPASGAVVPPPPATPARIDKRGHDDGYGPVEAIWRRAAGEVQQGRTTEAVASLREVLQAAPGHGDARQLLLSILVERRQWPEAEALLSEGLVLAPGHVPWAMALARIQVERGQTEAAWRTLDKFMAAGQQDAEYQGFAGVLLQRLQRPAEAIAHYEAALRQRPEARWWIGLGLALEGVGRGDAARDAFRRAQTGTGLTPEMTTLLERRLGGKP